MNRRGYLVTAGLLTMVAGIVAASLAIYGQGSSAFPSGPSSYDTQRTASDASQQPGAQESSPGVDTEKSGAGLGRNKPASRLVYPGDLVLGSRFDQLLPIDAIAPIYSPQFISGKLASLHPEELVIGVEINGESKAYPVGPLNYREMVNDVIGGVPVLVTW